MNTSKDLVIKIIEGIQEKKGYDIVVANLTNIITAPCEYFVICTGNSPQHVDSLCESVEEFARTQMGERPSAVAGTDNSIWIAMDYGTVMVHLFVPEAREHYDLENLWEDSILTEIPNVD